MSQIAYENESEKLKKFEKNSEWFQSHYDELKERYKNEYVAINNEQVVGHHKGLQEKYGDISSFVIRQVHEQQIAYIISYLVITYRLYFENHRRH